jgi:TPR repeat protein
MIHMAVWIVFFGSMAVMGKADGMHPGDSLPFWEQACIEDRPTACNRLIQLEASYCGDNSAWACNELGGHYRQGDIVGSDADLALGYFSRACELRFQPACVNLLDIESFRQADPRALDLRLLLREGGSNLMEMAEPELYERACLKHDWDFACDKVVSAS